MERQKKEPEKTPFSYKHAVFLVSTAFEIFEIMYLPSCTYLKISIPVLRDFKEGLIKSTRADGEKFCD
ncbi:MAG: hypothetical protein LUD69_06165, partial [Oscillospiraceae bacterium]|nr:hypothetical protein [Oscillospiraceae bacterium]